ncbi:hypothetical protein FIBSPDRAFT_1014509 [Athelia psychrophila]|uniref:Uncharacterized protein n=1 Tax=Athelia psychrophila TaxID=1759441 RepID=A0A167UBL9_9AGAM|nr:hypothetical protein FIBSPDRAFT_1014509 [Fibularhizoctonia sp. CBS 109695]
MAGFRRGRRGYRGVRRVWRGADRRRGRRRGHDRFRGRGSARAEARYGRCAVVDSGRRRRGGRLGDVLQNVDRIGPWASKILPDHLLEGRESLGLDVELPVQVLAHLPLHLVHLPQLEHSLPDNPQDLFE